MHPTVCRICEAHCGLLADVEDGVVTRLSPDPEHPLSKGYVCPKGPRFVGVQNAPDRLLRPRWRGQEVSWDVALDRVSAGLVRPAIYLGNPGSQSLGALVGVERLRRALSAPLYTALSLDNAAQIVVAEGAFGNPLHTFVADYDGSDLIVLFGTDPLSSQASQMQSNPGAVHSLLKARERLVVVDPRASMTAKAAGWHLAPRVGTDAFLLAGLLRALGSPLPVERFTPAFVEATCALPAGSVERLAARLRSARQPLVWSGLGVLLGPHPTLGAWLTLALQAAASWPGGWRWQPGAVPVARLAPFSALKARAGRPPEVLGALPCGELAGAIEAGEVRSLVVVAGNPLVSFPDTKRLRQALGSLDLLVCIDQMENDTGRLAHALLPAATWLEREEVDIPFAALKPVPHLQHLAAVVPPRGEARPDEAILGALARRAGGWPWPSAMTLARLAVATTAPFSWARLLAAPRGLTGRPAAPGSPGPGPRPRLDDPARIAELAALSPPPAGLRLITSVRPPTTMNSWLGAPARTVRAHPDDLPGPRVRVVGPAGTLELDAVADDTLARGTVVLAYGSADHNANVLIGSDLDPGAGVPRSNGSLVTLERV